MSEDLPINIVMAVEYRVANLAQSSRSHVPTSGELIRHHPLQIIFPINIFQVDLGRHYWRIQLDRRDDDTEGILRIRRRSYQGVFSRCYLAEQLFNKSRGISGIISQLRLVGRPDRSGSAL